MYWVLYAFAILFWPVVIILIIRHFLKRKKGDPTPSQNKNWYLQLSLSPEDGLSQWFLLISLIFLGMTLNSFNRDFGEPLSWRLIALITSLVGLTTSYYLKVISLLLASLIGLVVWWVSQTYIWIQDKETNSAALLVGISFISLLFYVLGHIHEKDLKYKRFALIYLILGIVSISGILFFISTKVGLSLFGEITKGTSFINSWQMATSILVFTVALIATTLYSFTKKLLFIPEVIFVFILMLLFGSIIFLPQQNLFITSGNNFSYFENILSSSGIFWAVIFNLVLFFELLGLIFSGYLRREEWLINLGTIFLFLLIIVKYFDWFFAFLDKSVFFIGAGILLFGVGWFMEKGRRIVVANLRNEQELAKH